MIDLPILEPGAGPGALRLEPIREPYIMAHLAANLSDKASRLALKVVSPALLLIFLADSPVPKITEPHAQCLEGGLAANPILVRVVDEGIRLVGQGVRYTDHRSLTCVHDHTNVLRSSHEVPKYILTLYSMLDPVQYAINCEPIAVFKVYPH